MRSLALVYHEDYLLHEHTPTHPERRERLQYTMDQLEEEGLLDDPAVSFVAPSPATVEQLERVHTRDYLEELRSMSAAGEGKLSVDTHVSEHTWESARLAAGGVIEGLEAPRSDAYDTAFVMARPGGHHAFADRGHGFCFLNNTAVGLRHLQATADVDRILVWDWDAHHGDGTQSIFYDDPGVLVLSTHQSGETLFPGTGFVDEVGEGAGEGYNVNVPLPRRTGDSAYLEVVEEVFEPVTRQYDPDLLFVEAGQDNHFTDPITDLGVTASGYASLMERAVGVADEVDATLVASLAGGYAIEAGLPYTNLAVFASLLGYDTSNIREPAIYGPPPSSPGVGDVIDEVQRAHADYWDFPG
ncbi:MAG: histone deacetylase family protein [Halobacteriales archaeon]